MGQALILIDVGLVHYSCNFLKLFQYHEAQIVDVILALKILMLFKRFC